MPYGIAVRVGPAPARFHAESVLFRLHPSLGQSENDRAHVVVAVTPRASDHGEEETTVFFVDEKGEPDLYGGLESAEALGRKHRVVGEQSVEAGLRNLRYLEVPAERLAELRVRGSSMAREWAAANKVEDPADYASNNWGMFAARHLVEAEGVVDPVPVANTQRWPSRAKGVRRAPEWSTYH